MSMSIVCECVSLGIHQSVFVVFVIDSRCVGESFQMLDTQRNLGSVYAQFAALFRGFALSCQILTNLMQMVA